MAANFPTTAPTLYADKSTANDVGDVLHWDGADANGLKDELIAVAAKVGLDGDADPDTLDYRVAALEERSSVAPGNGALGTSTATTVADSAVTSASCVLVQGTCAAFYALSPIPYVSARTAGHFTLTHGNAAGAETFDYLVVN